MKGALVALLLIFAPTMGRAAPADADHAPIATGTAPASRPAGTITLSAVRIEGAQTLTPTAFAPAIAFYLRRPLSPAKLSGLATDVAAFARRAGHGAATAWIPRQKISAGVLTLILDEGGSPRPSNAGQAPVPERPADARPDPDPPAPPAAAAPAPSEQLPVGAVRVEGAVALPQSAFSPAVEPYLGRSLSDSDLRSLATDVANIARRAGYGMATAWVPEQRVANGLLTVTIDEGRIHDVEVEGEGRSSVEPLLAILADGKPVRTADLERQLLIAGDRAGISVGQPRLDRRDGRNVLHVTTTRKGFSGQAHVDNWGSAALGPLRIRLDLDVNGLIGSDDRLSIGGVVTPLQPREFQFVRLAYAVPVGNHGTEVSVSAYAGHSEPGAIVRDRGLDGTTVEVKAAVSHPLTRSRDTSLWANAELGLRDTGLDEAGIEVRSDRIATAGAAIHGVSRVGKGWIRARLAVTKGIGAFGATREGDPLASRPDGSAVFTKLNFSSQYAVPLDSKISVSLAMEGQLASRALLASEQMGLGGRAFLRAYDYHALAGDHGAAASAELRYDMGALGKSLRRTQFYLYGDAGTVSNMGSGIGGGTLASAGGGVRLWLRNKIEASFELGLPLKDTPYLTDPNPRFWFSVGYAF